MKLLSFALLLTCTQQVFTGRPKYEYISSDSIPELQYLDASVDPCDDFYQYACGNFKNVRPKPDGEHVWDHFVILQQEVHSTMRLILDGQRKGEDPVALQKAKSAYKSCLDTEYSDLLRVPQSAVMDDLGVWPLIRDDGGEVEPITLEDTGRITARYGVQLFLKAQVLPDYYNDANNIIYINRDALSDPETYYPRFQRNMEDYLEIPVLTRGSYEDNENFERFLRTVALRMRDVEGTSRSDEAINSDISETIAFIAKLQNGGIINPDIPQFTSSIVTVAQLQEWTNGYFGDKSIDWLAYLNSLFSASDVEIKETTKVMHTPYLTYGVLNLFLQTDARTLRNFIMVRLFTYMAPDSDAVMREAFDTYYKNQNYDVFPRWEYCMRKVLGYPDRIDYSMALTYEYQRYHFNINKLAAAADMVRDLMDAFEDMLREAEWIDQETRENALQKLEYMYILLGYPEFVEDPESLDEYYDGLRVCTWEHFGNSQRARAFGQIKNFELIGKERSRENWNISPLEVNAFYNRATNRILFPVGVLNPVFFGGNISALDYGRIGAIIGHEITHGYDQEGRTYDGNGLLTNWWTNATKEAFAERAQCFLDQYGQYYIEEIDQYVNASQTLNENIADNGGLRQAYKALQKLQAKAPTIKTVENFTPEQLFFIGYGTMWCMTETEYYLQQMHKSGGHAPGRFRVIGAVSNMQEFADAFGCAAERNMNPEGKCVLW